MSWWAWLICVYIFVFPIAVCGAGYSQGLSANSKNTKGKSPMVIWIAIIWPVYTAMLWGLLVLAAITSLFNRGVKPPKKVNKKVTPTKRSNKSIH